VRYTEHAHLKLGVEQYALAKIKEAVLAVTDG